MLVLLVRNTQIRFLNERLNSRNSLKTNLRNASLKSSHSLKLKLLKLNKSLKTALAQTQQMATSNPAEAASVKEAATKIEAKQKELEESQAMVDNLPAPSYQFYSRREIPGF